MSDVYISTRINNLIHRRIATLGMTTTMQHKTTAPSGIRYELLPVPKSNEVE